MGFDQPPLRVHVQQRCPDVPACTRSFHFHRTRGSKWWCMYNLPIRCTVYLPNLQKRACAVSGEGTQDTATYPSAREKPPKRPTNRTRQYDDDGDCCDGRLVTFFHELGDLSGREERGYDVLEEGEHRFLRRVCWLLL